MSVIETAQCLTDRGWVEYTNIRVGEDQTLGYDYRTQRLEWTVIDALYAYEDSSLVRLGNGAWEMIVTEDQSFFTNDNQHVLVGAVTPTTRILTQTLSVEQNLPVLLASRRRYVTNLSVTPATTLTAWNITTGVGSWYMRQGTHDTIIRGAYL